MNIQSYNPARFQDIKLAYHNESLTMRVAVHNEAAPITTSQVDIMTRICKKTKRFVAAPFGGAANWRSVPVGGIYAVYSRLFREYMAFYLAARICVSARMQMCFQAWRRTSTLCSMHARSLCCRRGWCVRAAGETLRPLVWGPAAHLRHGHVSRLGARDAVVNVFDEVCLLRLRAYRGSIFHGCARCVGLGRQNGLKCNLS